MFDDLISDSGNTIMVARLNRSLSSITGKQYSTREEYQIAIYSIVNRILSLQNTMQPLKPVKGETPAAIGDVSTNLGSLNDDATDIASQMSAVQVDTARLFNLAETMQNTVRQTLREKLYASNVKTYVESFINSNNIQSSSCVIDNAAGVCLLPLITETTLSPSLSIGISSIGSSTDAISNLLDGDVTTRYVWNGTRLELLISFSKLQIVNRLYIDLDNYEGLDIVEFNSSPDGNVYSDVLSLLGEESISLDSTSGKNSGSVVIDFTPQYCINMKIVFNDVTGLNTISLRGLSFTSREYSSSGQITSTLISNPTGNVSFDVDSFTSDYASILHQISYDNIHFIAVSPGILSLSQPFWYRATLVRSDSAFTSPSVVDLSGSNVTTINLGSGILERTVTVANVTSSIVLQESIIPGSLKVQVGSLVLPSSQYSFANNVITLNTTPALNVAVTYQTSSVSASALQAVKNYYTPQLKEVRFTN